MEDSPLGKLMMEGGKGVMAAWLRNASRKAGASKHVMVLGIIGLLFETSSLEICSKADILNDVPPYFEHAPMFTDTSPWSPLCPMLTISNVARART